MTLKILIFLITIFSKIAYADDESRKSLMFDNSYNSIIGSGNANSIYIEQGSRNNNDTSFITKGNVKNSIHNGKRLMIVNRKNLCNSINPPSWCSVDSIK